MLSTKGEISMNLKIVKVELLAIDPDTDILRFFISDTPLDVNLNSPDCQSSLKSVFSALLKRLVTEDISLNLEINPDFTRGMYIEVCTQYIEDINRELNEVKEDIRNELKD